MDLHELLITPKLNWNSPIWAPYRGSNWSLIGNNGKDRRRSIKRTAKIACACSQRLLLRWFQICSLWSDIRHQQANRPTGSHDVVKPWISGAQGLYGYKTELSVIPTSFCIHYTKREFGSTSQISLFKKYEVEQQSIENVVHDDEVYNKDDLYEWVSWADKEYHMVIDYVKVVPSKRNRGTGFQHLSINTSMNK